MVDGRRPRRGLILSLQIAKPNNLPPIHIKKKRLVIINMNGLPSSLDTPPSTAPHHTMQPRTTPHRVPTIPSIPCAAQYHDSVNHIIPCTAAHHAYRTIPCTTPYLVPQNTMHHTMPCTAPNRVPHHAVYLAPSLPPAGSSS